VYTHRHRRAGLCGQSLAASAIETAPAAVVVRSFRKWCRAEQTSRPERSEQRLWQLLFLRELWKRFNKNHKKVKIADSKYSNRRNAMVSWSVDAISIRMLWKK
jgi:hypothetical protein